MNNYRPWEAEDLSKLKEMVAEEKSLEDMKETLNRSSKSIGEQIKELKPNKPQEEKEEQPSKTRASTPHKTRRIAIEKAAIDFLDLRNKKDEY